MYTPKNGGLEKLTLCINAHFGYLFVKSRHGLTLSSETMVIFLEPICGIKSQGLSSKWAAGPLNLYRTPKLGS